MSIYHDIITEFVHEVCCLGPFVVVEPDSSLKLVSSVQKQHVLLISPDLWHFAEPPGDSSEAGARGATFPRVLTGLLDPRVVVVGVQQGHLESPHCAQTQEMKEAERGAESAPSRPGCHGAAVRKGAPVTKNVKHTKKAWTLCVKWDVFKHLYTLGSYVRTSSYGKLEKH